MGFVQSASASDDTSTASIAVTLAAPVNSDNLICVHVAHGGTTDQVLSMVDSLGTIYKQQQFLAGTNVSGSIWSGIAPIAGRLTLTVTLVAAQQFRRLAVHEVFGFEVFDVSSATRFALGVCGDSGNITPSVDGCYVFGCTHADQGGDYTIAAGTNVAWTLRENYQHANAPAATEDFIQTTAAALAAAFVEGSCTLWRIYYAMAFRPKRTPRYGAHGFVAQYRQ